MRARDLNAVFTAAVISVLAVGLLGGCGREADEFRITQGSGVVAEAAERGTESPPDSATEPQQDAGDAGAGGSDDASGTEVSDPGTGDDRAGTVVVDICGAVARPGVYELPEGSRLYQAVEAAGGLLEEADRKRLSQAAPVTDGEHIIVYTVGEPELSGGVMPDGGDGRKEASVNINTAGVDELTSLSGIGAGRAQAIVDDRTQNGAFKSPEDIMRVSGIGEGIFDRIREDITV